MVLTIKNFESQNVWPWVVETAPTNLVWVAGTLKATLTWTSATWESWVTWTEEKLVRKEWSAPTWSMDGTTVATITTKDTYASTWYEDTGLDSTKTYYYKVFAVYDNGTEMWSTDVSVTPTGYTPWPTTIAYRPLTSTTTVNDQKNNYHLANQGWVVFGEYKGVDCAYFNMNSNSRLKIASFPTNNQSFTVFARLYLVNNNATSGRNDQIAFWWWSNCGVFKDSYVNRNTLKWIFDLYSWTVWAEGPWTFVAITYNSSTRKGSYYKNDTLVWELTQTITAGTTFAVGSNYTASGTDKKWKGWISEIWVDWKVRTAQELSDYYNNMKYKYWL